jgi:hypothetical protein
MAGIPGLGFGINQWANTWRDFGGALAGFGTNPMTKTIGCLRGKLVAAA